MGSAVSSTARASIDRKARQGHSYSEIMVTDNARAHNGDVYNIRNFYGSWPDALPPGSQQGVTWKPYKALRGRQRTLSGLEDKPCLGGNPFLKMAIDQLGDFSTSLRHQKHDEAARRVVLWLRVIVDAIEASGTASQEAHTEKELADMQHGLLFINRVGINAMGKRKTSEQVVKATRKSSLLLFDKWRIALDTISWEALDEHARRVTGSFSALRLTPLELASASPVAAFFGERTDYHHTSMIHPTILTYRRISEESKVFQYVNLDHIDGLMKILAEHKATTRDVDEDGRSLLHVSMVL
jgi:hypothetical protein